MKFTKKRDFFDTTIQRVWSDDDEVMFGYVGTVGDMLDAKLLEWCEYSEDLWLFLPALGVMQQPHFGKSRDEALENIQYR